MRIEEILPPATLETSRSHPPESLEFQFFLNRTFQGTPENPLASVRNEDSSANLRARIRTDGLVKYADDLRMEQLRATIRREVMSEFGVTGEGLRAMPKEVRAQVEQRIEEEVERRLKMRLEAELGEDGNWTFPGTAEGDSDERTWMRWRTPDA